MVIVVIGGMDGLVGNGEDRIKEDGGLVIKAVYFRGKKKGL